MSDRLRFAVIGAGGIGLSHLHSIMHCPRASAVAVADSNAARAKEAADRYRISRSYTDYRDILDQPDVEAVTIALPNHLHMTVAAEALRARKHVLVEKPMALNAKEAAKACEVARKMRRVFMVAQNLRFEAGVQTAKQLIERGDLGEVYQARCFWRRRAGIPRIGSWFTQKKLAGGGCTADLGVHMLDCCLHLLGEFDVAAVSAQMSSKFGPRGQGELDWGRSEVDPARPFDVEDSSVALIRLRSGRVVLLESAWAGYFAPDSREQGIDLLGTQAGLALFPARLFRQGPAGYETVDPRVAKLTHPEDRIHHFVQCVLDDRKPLVTLEQSVKVQAILDALYASARTGKEVRL